MSSQSRIVQLAHIISSNTTKLEEFRQSSGQPDVSFDVNAAPSLAIPPSETSVLEARNDVLAASRELTRLMQSPSSTLQECSVKDAFALHMICRFNIAELVPVSGETTFPEIAREIKLPQSDVERILRYAMTSQFFEEPSPGKVRHTSASRLIREDKLFHAAMGITFEETFPAAAKAVDALEKHPGSQEPIHSGWGVANQATSPFFEELAKNHKQRHRVVSGAMDAWNRMIPSGPLIENYPWGSFQEGKVVDVGGGHGGLSVAIASRFPGLKLVVQDLPAVVEEGTTYVPAELQGRIEFMAHDFFAEQPIAGADVYLLRSIFHDWPDKYCVKILKALVPALKPGARVIINDNSMPPPGTLPPTANREKLGWDIAMVLLCNARDRADADWAKLFEEADPRFEFQGVRLPTKGVQGLPPQAVLSIIEAVWKG